MDRNGKILADNQPAYSLTIDRVILKPLVKADASHRAKLFTFLAISPRRSRRRSIEARCDKGKARSRPRSRSPWPRI